ncbi:MAG TPA: phosphoribosyltransferase family protein [Actinoplanes sp.]
MLLSLLGDVADLFLPSACAGCGAERVRLRYGACDRCAAALEALTPLATAPRPPPPGMPRCVAVGPYAGELRGTLLAYKERGRHRLARPLGTLLASAVARLAPKGAPVFLVPIPSTAAATRERGGDHMTRLAAHAVRRLREAGWQADLTHLLRALPKPDAASLSVGERAVAAESSLRIRPARIGKFSRRSPGKGTLVVVDDIVTTGATLAVATARLEEANVQVTGAAVLAATRLRRPSRERFATFLPGITEKAERRPSGIPNEG